MKLNSVAVVTVSYNSSAQLDAFLTSARNSGGEDIGLFIADNNSNDLESTRAIAKRMRAEVHELPTNLGYGQAINAVVGKLPTRFDAVMVANPDVTFSSSAIEILVRCLAIDPSIGAVGPRILNVDGSTYPSARRVPSLTTGSLHAVLHGIWPSNPWSTRYRSDAQGQMVRRDVGWLSGACVLLRRDAFESVGGFSSDYFMYFEDVDLGVRLTQAGWRNVYEPEATITHVGGESTKVESDAMIRAHHASAATFVSSTHPRWFEWPVRVAVRAGLAVRQRVKLSQARRARAASRE